MNIRKILFALTKAGSPFHYRRHYCAVPNLSWGLLEWEADLAVVTRSDWLWEIEIKTNAADWHADRNKAKWALMEKPGVLVPRRFYYAAPIELAKQWDYFDIPHWAGVVGIESDAWGRLRVETIRVAADRAEARKLTAEEKVKTARLASMRFWTENHKAVQRLECKAQLETGPRSAGTTGPWARSEFPDLMRLS